jgi:hypothetical protein
MWKVHVPKNTCLPHRMVKVIFGLETRDKLYGGV